MNDVKSLIATYLDQLWRRRWIALAFAWTVCLVGWFSVALMPDRYVSEARFYVDTLSLLNPLLRGISVSADDHSKDQQVAIMQRTLTSRPNLMKIAQMTDLDKGVRSEAGMQALTKSLEDRISIRSQGPNLFTVEFSDNSPVVAKSVVQSLLTIFVESSSGNKREDIHTAQSFIDTQIVNYETQLKAAEQRLADFKVKNVGFFSSNSQTFAMRLEAARDNIDRMKLEYNDAAAERDQLRRQVASTPQLLALDAASPFTGAPAASPFQQRVQTLQARLNELKMQYTDKHPEVIQTRQALEALLIEQRSGGGKKGELSGGDLLNVKSQVPNELHAQLSLRLSQAETRLGSIQRRLEEAEAQFADMEKKASEAPQIEAQFTNLNRDYEVLKASYEGLLQRRESARISAAADSTTEPVQFRLIAAPELPARPAGPKRALFNTLVLLLGLGAGAGFVILLGRVEQRVTSADDLYELGDYTVLGCVTKATTFAQKLCMRRQMHRFGAAFAGLVVIFLLLLGLSPNFSSILHTLGVWS